ncbi:deca-heme c-type cytochrome [Vibrio sp. B1Z05]|nr:deca-heme c-type cytochrome [Vibrio sp. B1Z05]
MLTAIFRVFLLLFFCYSSMLFASEYVGSDVCQSCHEQEHEQWQTSQHFDAMAEANSQTVKGNFDNQTVLFKGEKYHFSIEDGQYWVTLKDQQGQFNKYKVSYTFAIYPLQQYMVEFADGRVQLIPFAWDTRDKSDGGQRWFHLYPEFDKPSDDFFWLNHGQNWNYMCADCHSTNLQKGYDSKLNRYNTTWSEINVGCEACHGPSAQHIKDNKVATPYDVTGRDINSDPVCAQCHSRRIQLNEDGLHPQFSQRHKLNLISSDLYYPDGQIFDEDYVYGSFLQSKMHKAGVTCSDCHNPHTAKIKLPEPQLCQQCHSAEQYNAEKHAHHPIGLETDKCSSCHMVEQNYMQVDWRKDHSFQIPRPELSDKTGAPNACTNCHQDQSNQWASEHLNQWFERDEKLTNSHFSLAFSEAESGNNSTNQALADIALDEDQAFIIRASALSRMQYFADSYSLNAINKLFNHPNQYIRQGVLDALIPQPIAQQKLVLKQLLNDPVLLIRSEAAASLIYLDSSELSKNPLLNQVLSEYLEIQEYLSDRGANRSNIGDVAWLKGNLKDAEQHYLQAIIVEPNFVAPYLKLNNVYRTQNKQQQATSILAQGLKRQPNNEQLLYQYGLANIRLQKLDAAIASFEQLLTVVPNNAQYQFVTGLAYESVNLEKAIQHIGNAYQISRDVKYIEAYCAVLQRNNQALPNQCFLQ